MIGTRLREVTPEVGGTAARVAVVVSHPIQHFCPLYRAIALDGRLELKVFFGSRAGMDAYFDRHFDRSVSWGGSLLDGYGHEFLPGAESVRDPARPVSNATLPARLDAYAPSAVVSYGWYHPIARAAYAWARQHGARALMISDSADNSRADLLGLLRWRLVVPRMLREVDGFLTVGDANERFYARHGARPAQFFRSPFPVDETSFSAASQDRRRLRTALRARLGLTDSECLFLAVGKLTERKRIADAIRAVARAGRGGLPVRLAIVGDGPGRSRLEALAASQAPGLVSFAGYVAPAGLPEWYLTADVLVHPSARDHHPLAVSEAVVCELPCIVSDRVGSVGPTDDARPGVNAFVVKARDWRVLGDTMLKVAADRQLRETMSAGSRQIAQERTMAASVEGFVRGVLAGSRRRTESKP